jgi:hypothetical protein
VCQAPRQQPDASTDRMWKIWHSGLLTTAPSAHFSKKRPIPCLDKTTRQGEKTEEHDELDISLQITATVLDKSPRLCAAQKVSRQISLGKKKNSLFETCVVKAGPSPYIPQDVGTVFNI